jgi:hypothetical protein
MPSGSMPTYKYRPAVPGEDPFLRTRSSRRARLFLGGTYFRARDPGGKGNNISIEVLELPSEGDPDVLVGKVVVTNHNTRYDENVTGPVTVDVLDQQLNWNERYVIDQLSTTPRALRYSVNLATAVGVALQEDLGPFAFGRLLHIPSKLSAKLTLKPLELTPGDVITIKPRTRVYDLTPKTVTVPGGDGGGESGGSTVETGWDIALLRAAVNASDPWIEMMERSVVAGGEGGGGFGGSLIDAQDDGQDADFLTPFPDTYLSGGDGLPDHPSVERTGPTRSIVHVNYGERYDGTFGDLNEVYEWVGDTGTAGEWKRY